MAIIAAALAAFFTAMTEVISVLIPALLAAITLVVSALIAVLGIAIGAVGAIVTGLIGIVTLDFTLFSTWVTSTYAFLEGYLTIAYEVFMTYVNSIMLHFKEFLEIIHFKTIIKIHEVAYLVSEDYRNLARKIFTNLSEFSSGIGFGALGLHVLIENARNMFLDLSTMMGYKYDLGEVAWLKQYSDFMQKLGDYAKKVANNPKFALELIEEWLIKPTIDAKGTIMQVFISNIDAALTGLSRVVDDLEKTRKDFGKLIADLPEQLREKIKPWLDEKLKVWDDWIANIYNPYKRDIERILQIYGAAQDKTSGDVKGLIDRLKSPSSYLRSIYDLPSYDALAEQSKISDISESQFNIELADYTPPSEAMLKELMEKAEKIKRERKPPEWYVEEHEGISRPRKEEVKKRSTWFVGDY